MNIQTLTFPTSQINNWVPLNLSGVKFIVLHHPEAVTASPDDINSWHLQNGWKGGFGYNEYIRKDGTVYIGRGDHIGAQCLNYNSISYGICCEGNYDKETSMSAAQYESLQERIKYHLSRFSGAVVKGHKELCDTACPGQYFPLQQCKEITISTPSPVENALQKLVTNHVISSPDYWRSELPKVQYLDALLIKMANRL